MPMKYKENRERFKQLKKETNPFQWMLAKLNAVQIMFKERHETGKKAERARLCELYGVENTGRQWTRLRKQLAYQSRHGIPS